MHPAVVHRAVVPSGARRPVAHGPRPMLGPVAVAAAAGVFAAVVIAVDPNEAGHYPTCPVLELTGYFCTGCGVLRAVHALLRLDLATAWQMNPLFLLVIPMIIGSWVAWLIRAWTGRPRRWLAPPWLVGTLLAAMFVFTVARNVPAFGWLAPG